MRDVLPPILCIIGKKNSGKTTLTVALAAELNRRGRKVMTVKHGHGFQVDQPGRDSWRHRHEGGAVRTVMAGPRDFAVVGEWPGEEMSLAELVQRFLWDAEIVLAEGFKNSPEPKIEVYRREAQPAPLFDHSAQEGDQLGAQLGAQRVGQQGDQLGAQLGAQRVGQEGVRMVGQTLALVTDEEGLDLPIPVFALGSPEDDGLMETAAALADFVESTFLNEPVGE